MVSPWAAVCSAEPRGQPLEHLTHSLKDHCISKQPVCVLGPLLILGNKTREMGGKDVHRSEGQDAGNIVLI